MLRLRRTRNIRKHQDQISLVTESEEVETVHEGVVDVKLNLKRKAYDAKGAKSRKKKKHQDQKFPVTKSEKEIKAGTKGKESDVPQKTIYDVFLGQEVPDIGQTTSCGVCGRMGHYDDICSYLKYFPKGTKKIGVHYEKICLGCTRIEEVCCSKGGYALAKTCRHHKTCRHCGGV